ncbi:hypothetical protein NMY22_g19246 [Coprinellus aureogranulatus]|nr:hypothetical protein NMY22_g19246 [Coprinellus aureogranulatus]
MTRTGWATKEEREYLIAQIPDYEACQVKRRYKPFWQRVNAEFLSKFPVIDKLFPGLKITDLSPQQKELYTAAVQRQQQRLKEWYRWQLNPRSRNAGTVLSKKDLHTIYSARTRSAKPYEVFAKLYSQQVDDEKRKRCEANGICKKKPAFVNPANLEELKKGLSSGAIKRKFHIVKVGIEQAPKALPMLFSGGNTGKLYVLACSSSSPDIGTAHGGMFFFTQGGESVRRAQSSCEAVKRRNFEQNQRFTHRSLE